MVGLAAGVGHPSLSCLCSGFLFGEFADDTNEGSILILQPLVVRLQLCQNLQRDKDKVGSEGLGGKRGHCIPHSQHISMALQHLQSFHKLAARRDG